MLRDTFIDDIEKMVRGGASYIDAVTTWCQSQGLEPEAGADLVKRHPVVAMRLQMEAESMSLLRK